MRFLCIFHAITVCVFGLMTSANAQDLKPGRIMTAPARDYIRSLGDRPDQYCFCGVFGFRSANKGANCLGFLIDKVNAAYPNPSLTAVTDYREFGTVALGNTGNYKGGNWCSGTVLLKKAPGVRECKCKVLRSLPPDNDELPYPKQTGEAK